MNIHSYTFYMVLGDRILGHFMELQALNIKLHDFSPVVRHCQPLNAITWCLHGCSWGPVAFGDGWHPPWILFYPVKFLIKWSDDVFSSLAVFFILSTAKQSLVDPQWRRMVLSTDWRSAKLQAHFHSDHLMTWLVIYYHAVLKNSYMLKLLYGKVSDRYLSMHYLPCFTDNMTSAIQRVKD